MICRPPWPTSNAVPGLWGRELSGDSSAEACELPCPFKATAEELTYHPLLKEESIVTLCR